MEAILTILIKMKAYIIAIFVAYISATVRYVEYRRKINNGTFDKKKIKLATKTDWFLFGIMASIITMTGLACLEYMGLELNMPFALLLFWLGYMTDYLFQWVPIMIKKKLGNEINIK